MDNARIAPLETALAEQVVINASLMERIDQTQTIIRRSRALLAKQAGITKISCAEIDRQVASQSSQMP
jgi:hypothetical protein